MSARAAGHVLLVEPVDFRYNPETSASNVFQNRLDHEQAAELGRRAQLQHRTLRDMLVANGVQVTTVRSRAETPDAPFCNNWFSTHPATAARPGGTLVLYPLLAPNRRIERRQDIIRLLRQGYPNLVDYSDRETRGTYLESTGSLILDDQAQVAYAALSPRTDARLAEEWAAALGYRLVAFQSTDASGVPYYHTNVMMFIGHGLVGVCLESITSGRELVDASLRASGLTVLPITRDQVLKFCGNCLPLVNDQGDKLLVMSSAAYAGFTAADLAVIAHHAAILHTDLSAFEQIGGGSARCLLGELF